MLLAAAGGCTSRAGAVLERATLFQLELGRLEDQVDLFAVGGVAPRETNAIAIQDGLVFVSNGAARKIMRFTSFGELIHLIYDPDRNPEPVTLAAARDDEVATTQVAVTHRFGELGTIAVDNRGVLYAEDRLARERAILDQDLDVLLDRIVVRFDALGRQDGFIGQEGVGGTPFPTIRGLWTTESNELIVVGSTVAARMVYAYSAEGQFRYSVEISLDRLPVPDAENSYISVLDQIVPSIEQPFIYLLISYYRTSVDDQTGNDVGIVLNSARIYRLDLRNGLYDSFVELPTPGGRALNYEFVGVARDERFFLISRGETGDARLSIIGPEGRVVRRRTLVIPDAELVARSLIVTPTGLLAALFAFDDRAEVVWWRSDRILPSAR